MKVLHRIFASCCFRAVALTLVAVSSALAQQSVAPPVEPLSSMTPKDAHTRAKLHTELGSLYFRNGDLIIALEELTIAISIDANYAQAYSTRGLVLYQIKEFASAEKDFQRALDLAPKDPQISNNYGWFLCNTGKEKESIEYFRRAINDPLYQTPALAHLNAGTCYARINELDLAEDYIRKTLRYMPDNPQALLQLANISYKRGNYDAAKEHLKKVVRLSNPNAEALWLFLRVERRLGNSSDEISLAAQLRRKYPDSPEYQEFLKGNFE